MPTCPECDSRNVEGGTEPYGYEHHSDGQGYEWTDVYYHVCNDCGCEWSEILETTRKIEIEKHGKPQN